VVSGAVAAQRALAGHTWPDGIIDLPQFGNTTRTIDATDLILDFFAAQ